VRRFSTRHRGDLVLTGNPALAVFLVASLGGLVARLRLGAFSAGIAAVLFAGIAVGAFVPSLVVPDPVWQIGLAVFVYTIGITSGPSFRRSTLSRRGLKVNLLVVVALAAAAAVAAGLGVLAGFGGPQIAGAFAGGETSTPALAGLLGALEGKSAATVAEPVVGYSLSYPFGVMLAVGLVYLLLRHQRKKSKTDTVCTRTIRIEHSNGTLGELRADGVARVAFGRVQRNGDLLIASDDLQLLERDLLTVTGNAKDVKRLAKTLGHKSSNQVQLDRSEYDLRRIAVSHRRVLGRTIAELDLEGTYKATITRVRRGDIEIVATPEMQLELGDRVRVDCPRTQLEKVRQFFGDSYRALGEFDALGLCLGITLGLLLGSVSVPLPGHGSFSLGFAGGPLIVGLVLGALGRTGKIVWQLPYTASLTLRQFGTTVFLAGLGIKAGTAFASALHDPSSLYFAGSGIAIAAVSLAVLVVGARLLHLGGPEAIAGLVSGAQSQPAVLAFATEQLTDDRELYANYATVFPFEMIVKILLAQVLLVLFT
jgi:putative transport protein